MLEPVDSSREHEQECSPRGALEVSNVLGDICVIVLTLLGLLHALLEIYLVAEVPDSAHLGVARVISRPVSWSILTDNHLHPEEGKVLRRALDYPGALMHLAINFAGPRKSLPYLGSDLQRKFVREVGALLYTSVGVLLDQALVVGEAVKVTKEPQPVACN